MKKLLFIISLIFFFSCNEQTNQKGIKNEPQQFTDFEKFLIEFKKNNPNWGNNQKTIKETSKIFKNELIKYFKNNDSVFYYHPLKLTKTSEDGKLGVFRIWGTDKIKYKGVESYYENGWNVDVVMELPKSQIDTLVENSYYRIIGKFIRYIKENDEKYNLSSYTFEPSISKNISNILEYNIGCLNIKPIKIEIIHGNEQNGDYFYLRKFEENND